MNIIKTKVIPALIFGLIGLQVIQAQVSYKFIKEGSLIRVTGTSTIHDWAMEAKDPDGVVQFKIDKNTLAGIKDLHVTIRSDRILSDNRIMNNKTHEALAAKKHPEIIFHLNEVKGFKIEDRKISGQVTGTLRIAGKSREISLPFTGIYKGEEIKIMGNKILNMSDFGIEPPTAMLGTLKTGDKVAVNFVTTWRQQDQGTAYLKEKQNKK